jgi:hypothetical protein
MQNLIRLREPWQHDLARRDPMIPESPGIDREIALHREINRLIPWVTRYMYAACIGTVVNGYAPDEHFDGNVMVRRHVERDWDIFENYFGLPRQDDVFRFQIDALERAIGYYFALQERAFRELFSPITWLAFLVRIPIVVLERAGVPMEDASSRGVQTSAWIMRLAAIVLLVLASTKLGLSIPWDKVLAWFK